MLMTILATLRKLARLRIQIINPDGVVIGDTDLSDHAAAIENHSDRLNFNKL